MLSSEGKPTNISASLEQVPDATPSKWEQEGECEPIFELIDRLLSFEACLYHQILPFELKDNNLFLGMVHPQDGEALDYVGRILSYINCTLVTEAIAAETHRKLLSAYLNHKNTSEQNGKPILPINSFPTITDKPLPPAAADSEPNQPLTLTVPDETQSNHHSWQGGDLPPMPQYPDNPSKITACITPSNKSQAQDTSKAALTDTLPLLPASNSHLFSPVEELPTLPPKKLLEELLGRILAGGIGRLYLERQPYAGRILWSDNGVLQSVLDKLPLSTFQGVLNELKRFASLPVATVAEPKQIEKECVYQKTRLLLRLRVMPGIYGEEATLQVLRGAALKFYQQQQLVRLSRDTVGIAQQLSFKLHELKERLLLNSSLDSQQLEALVTLNQLVENVDQQIKILSLSSDSSRNSNS